MSQRAAALVVDDFSEMHDEFDGRVRRIGFAVVATTDERGRPRTRILQPVWEYDPAGCPTGWLITSARSFKVTHIRMNPSVSVAYWDPAHEMVFAECGAAIEEDDATKQRIWDLFASGPAPYGYDPHRFFPDGPGNPDYCVVRLDPTRIELSALADRAARRPQRVWRRR